MRNALFAGVASLALLAGCTSGPNGSVVTLASAQAEAQAILVALEAGATVYTTASTTTPGEAGAVENVLAIAKESVATFEAANPTETPAELAETVSQDIAAVLAVMPIDPATKTAIDAGMAVIDALVAGLSAAPVPPVPTPMLTLAPHVLPAPPVPIPVPHRLPPRA